MDKRTLRKQLFKEYATKKHIPYKAVIGKRTVLNEDGNYERVDKICRFSKKEVLEKHIREIREDVELHMDKWFCRIEKVVNEMVREAYKRGVFVPRIDPELYMLLDDIHEIIDESRKHIDDTQLQEILDKNLPNIKF